MKSLSYQAYEIIVVIVVISVGRLSWLSVYKMGERSVFDEKYHCDAIWELSTVRQKCVTWLSGAWLCDMVILGTESADVYSGSNEVEKLWSQWSDVCDFVEYSQDTIIRIGTLCFQGRHMHAS